MLEPARKPELQIVPKVPPYGLDYYIQIFLEAKSGKSPKTVQSYRTPLSQFRRYALSASHSVGSGWPPTPEAINSFLYNCKARGLAEATLDAYYHSLKIWLDWLVKRGKLDSNPILLAERPPRPKIIPRAPRTDDVQKLFEHLKATAKAGHWRDVRSLAIWSLALDTGLRLGEIVALTVDDVSVTKKRLRAFIKGQKTHTDRVVIFDKKVAKDLKRWLKVRAGLPLPRNLNALFVAFHHGYWKGLEAPGIRQDLADRCAKIGLPRLTPKQFRNAYAVYSLRNRADILDVQRQMGHSRLSTTSRYVLVDDAGRAKRHKGHSPRGKL